MREILFKAKDSTSKSWVEGNLRIISDDKNDPFRKNSINYSYLIESYHPGDFNMGGYDSAEVDKNTICQYVERLDNNKKKIFDNDVVKFYYKASGFEGIVKYRNTEYVIDYMNENGELDSVSLNECEIVTVIKNLFD